MFFVLDLMYHFSYGESNFFCNIMPAIVDLITHSCEFNQEKTIENEKENLKNELLSDTETTE